MAPSEGKEHNVDLRVFISYNFADERLVGVISHLLRKQGAIDPFFYSHAKSAGVWTQQLADAITACHAFVYMAGREVGDTQQLEANWHFENRKDLKQQTLVVCLPGSTVPDAVRLQGPFDPVRIDLTQGDAAELLAKEISVRLTGIWTPTDGVPLGYLFDYEKDIVEAYVQKELRGKSLDIKLLQDGCPPDWPKVEKREATHRNASRIQEKFGAFRAASSAIAVDSRISDVDDQLARNASEIRRKLTFPEAGPREWHRYPLEGQSELRVAILVSGGIAPGINAVIDGIVKRHEAYHDEIRGRKYELTIFGYREGLQSLISEVGGRSPVTLTSKQVERQAEMGGSLLPTSRWDDFVHQPALNRDELLTQAVRSLSVVHAIDILYVIGGDGSMRAAHALSRKARALRLPLAVVAIPKTMDNDILWVWQSFGFMSAVEKAREAVLNLHTEAKSNPRLCILQLFGSDSGFVAAHAALASGVCDAVLIPEVDYTMEGLFKHLEDSLNKRHALVVMAETALPIDARRYVDGCEDAAQVPPELRVRLSEKELHALTEFFAQNRRVRGQTPDGLRTAGLKIVTGVLQAMIKQRMLPTQYWQDFRVFPNEPRHLIRSVPPSTSDVIFAERLGALAVDNAMAGYTDCIVSQWLTEFVLVPLELVILGRKRVPPDGVFWKSVLLSTGQPAQMTATSYAGSRGQPQELS
jgi:6-phosphofructokinase 1